MKTSIISALGSLLLLSVTACKWTEFDDLRDEAWVRAVTKPDGSKSSNWGVGIVRSKAASASGGQLAIFGDNRARLNQLDLLANGDTKFLSGDQDLGGLGIEQFPEAEPIVLADPESDDFAIVTQGAALQVVVATGNNLSLVPNVVQGAGAVDGAAYMLAPEIDTTSGPDRTPAIKGQQPLLASGNKLFGTFLAPKENPFNQTSCTLNDAANPINIRAVAPFRRAGKTTDEIVVWTDAGNLMILDGHVFNGPRSSDGVTPVMCPDPAAGTAGQLDISLAPPALIGTPVPVGFTPAVSTLAQILPFGDHFAVLQGHSNAGAFLALWDLTAGAAGGSGAIVGQAVMEPGLTNAALITVDGKTHVIAGYPAAVIDGVTTGKVEVYAIDTATGINASGPVESFNDAQPDDGEAFGRSVTSMEFNGQPIIAIAGNDEVFFYYRTPNLYTTDARQ